MTGNNSRLQNFRMLLWAGTVRNLTLRTYWFFQDAYDSGAARTVDQAGRAESRYGLAAKAGEHLR